MDDLYSDDAEPSPAPEEPREESEDSAQSTALLPKNFFQGKDLEAGKRCEVEIISEHEDEVEVRYVKHGGGKDSEEPEPENAMTAMLED